MLKNYFKVAYRNLIRYKGYTFINVLGLAIGIGCCLLILLYVFKELSYDRHHEKADRIYRLVQTMKSESRVDEGASTPFPAGPTLASEYPHLIENSVRFYNLQVPKLSLGIRDEEKYFKEPHFFFADSTVFDLFTFELLRGNPKTALKSPRSLVMTKQMAEKYFGDEDPIGKELFFEGRINLIVTGIMKDQTENSHIDIDFLTSFNTLDQFYKSGYATSWYWNPCWTYVLLKEGVDVDRLLDLLPAFKNKYYTPNIPTTDVVELDLQPLTDIHLYSDLDQEIKANGDIQYVYIFSVVAALVLFIACVNFVNLATARSAKRAREVGMRKVLGADRWRLFGQFMGESFLMCFLSILLSLAFVYLALPYFNVLLNTDLHFDFIGNIWILIGLFIVFILVGTGSGVYPAIFLSGIQPARSLRGDLTKGQQGQTFRRILVVIQFGFSILLIIGTLIVYQQLNLLREKKMGFNKDQIVMIPTDLTRTIWYYDDFKQKLLQNSDIRMVTGSKNVLGSQKNFYYKYELEGQSEPLSVPAIFVMHDFLETYDIELLAGRSFSKSYSTDRTEAVIVNEQLVREMGWGSPEEALGRSITRNDQDHYVIGVTENFNHTSLHRHIEPLILDMPDDEYGIVSNIEYIAVKINGLNVEEVLGMMQEIWNEFDTSHPFEYFFHDQQLEQIYKKEESMASVSAGFTLLAIVVACLGLFGLASFTAETRTCEIGIRKALGASVMNIVTLLSKEFITLVLIANLLAWPTAYYLAVKWLNDFPYRIELGLNVVLIFIIGGMAGFVISLVSVSYHSVKTALINPADSIREE